MVRGSDLWLLLVLGFGAAPEHGCRPRRRGAARRRHEPLLRVLVLQGPVQLSALLRRRWLLLLLGVGWERRRGCGRESGGGEEVWFWEVGGGREGVELGLAGVPGSRGVVVERWSWCVGGHWLFVLRCAAGRLVGRRECQVQLVARGGTYHRGSSRGFDSVMFEHDHVLLVLGQPGTSNAEEHTAGLEEANLGHRRAS